MRFAILTACVLAPSNGLAGAIFPHPYPAGEYALVVVRDGRIAVTRTVPNAQARVAAAKMHAAEMRTAKAHGVVTCRPAARWRNA